MVPTGAAQAAAGPAAAGAPGPESPTAAATRRHIVPSGVGPARDSTVLALPPSGSPAAAAPST